MEKKKTHRIGVISDTHGLLRPEVLEILKDCDAILHAGDIGGSEILKRLSEAGPFYGIRGNSDETRKRKTTGSSAQSLTLPKSRTVTLYGVTFFLIHDRNRMGECAADAIIFGHTHMYEEWYEGSRLWLNPGSCGPRRFLLPVTMALLMIEEGRISAVRKIELDDEHGASQGRERKSRLSGGIINAMGSRRSAMTAPEIPSDIRSRIPAVMRDMDRGRPIGQIAARAGISYELAEQICRLYVTHPGVDADGIMRKMGL